MTESSLSTPNDLTCRDVEKLILDYVEGSLADTERLRFEAHLRECRQCTTYLDAYRTSVTLAKAAFDGDAPFPESVPAELVAVVLAALRQDS